MKERALAVLDDLMPRFLDLSRWMYDHPELSGQEHQAAEQFAALLRRAGFAVEMGVAGLPTALAATFRGRQDAPRIALLAEYDALPGIGHGCGHNILVPASLAAAVALSRLGEDLPGTVVLYGCPAEETTGGKIAMAEAGCFDGLSAAMSVHPGTRDAVGGSSLASHPLQIEYFGQTAHAAASPHLGKNALDALVLTYMGLKSLLQHLRNDVRIPGIILDGGEAPNVIPDYARGRWSVRDVAEGAARMTGCRVQFEHYEPLFKDLRSNSVLDRLFKGNVEALGRGPVAVRDPRDRGGSTDVGNVSHVCPTIHPTMAIAPPGSVNAHTREFAAATLTEAGQRGLRDMAAAMVLTALDLMQEPRHLSEAWAEFRAEG